jgi:hypothetical protein
MAGFRTFSPSTEQARQLLKNRAFASRKSGDSEVQNRGPGSPNVRNTITPWAIFPRGATTGDDNDRREALLTARSGAAPIDSK